MVHKDATLRVRVGSTFYGSAALVGPSTAITALHVAQPEVNAPRSIHGPEGSQVAQADIEAVHVGGDLALLQLDRNLGVQPLGLGPVELEIGTELHWAGYPVLFGESDTHRLRAGWGRVASPIYERDGGTFYEVDGLFNPGHSGGPILNQNDQLVGVVSASAGNVDLLVEKWHSIGQAMQVLEQLSTLQSGGFFSDLSYPTPAKAVHDYQILKGTGLPVDVPKETEGKWILSINISQVSTVQAKKLAELGAGLVEAAEQTFQMGLGIASGGKPLRDLLAGRLS